MLHKQAKRTANFYYWVLGLLSLAYVALTVLAPVRGNTFDLNNTQLHLVQLTFVVPILFIWFLIVFGGIRFKNYALLIKGSQEARGLSLVADSLLLIAFGGIVVNLFGLLRTYVGLQFTEEFAITRNYLNLALQLASYGLLYIGSRRMVKSVEEKSPASHRVILPQLIVAGLVAVYAALMFTNQYRNATPDPTKFTSFYLPDALLLLTIIVPYAFVWTIAAGALVNLRIFANGVKGIVYRDAIRRLVLGMTFVVGFAIALGMLSSLSGIFAGSSLQFVLAFIYIILILYATGFLIIASGARKLSRIEEV